MKKIANDSSANLISLMEASILANGGNSDQASELSSLLDTFTISSQDYIPFIRIPFATEISLVDSLPLLAISDIDNPFNTPWHAYNYSSSQVITIQINETLASSQPIWNIRATTSDDIEDLQATWLPWRRCYCTRASHDVYEPGTVGTGGHFQNFVQTMVIVNLFATEQGLMVFVLEPLVQAAKHK